MWRGGGVGGVLEVPAGMKQPPSGWPVFLGSHPWLALGSSQAAHVLGQPAEQRDPERGAAGPAGGTWLTEAQLSGWMWQLLGVGTGAP